MSTVSPAELAARTHGHGVGINVLLARPFLDDWKTRRIVEEPFPGPRG